MHIYRLLLLPFLLFACQPQLQVSQSIVDNIEVRDEAIAASKEMEALILPYKNQIGDDLKEVIGSMQNELTLAKPESTLGNFLADICFKMCAQYLNQKIDFAFLNYGGVRVPVLAKGALRKGAIFELMPFDNKIVMLDIRGSDLKQLFDHLAENGGWPVSKQLKLVIQANKAVDVRINEQAVEAERFYKIATIDYIANGGDDCDFLVDKRQTATEKLWRDAIVDYCLQKKSKNESMTAQLEQRIFILE